MTRRRGEPAVYCIVPLHLRLQAFHFTLRPGMVSYASPRT